MVKLFKYLGIEGAKKTISTNSFKLSVPSTFNDPFDVRLDEILGLDYAQFAEQQKAELFNVLAGKLPDGTLRESEMGRKALVINKMLQSATPDQLAAIRSQLMATPLDQLYDLQSLKAAGDTLLATLKDSMSRYGVLCLAARNDSVLMWSHYAQHHEGAVLEFSPDVARDSALLASRPVQYQLQRPLVYRTPGDLVRRALLMSSEQSANEIVGELIYTKSVEWEYEHEYRLAIPNFVAAGAKSALLEFWPSELVAVYLGCRIKEADKQELKAAAQSLNTKVEVYEARVAPREYALVFYPI
jgi:hypothetical protein